MSAAANTLACARCASPLDAADLRCPICSLASPTAAVEDRPELGVEVLRCSGCGAAAEYDVAVQAPRCPFCGSVQEVEIPADPLEVAESFVPFAVDRGRAEAALRSWLGSLGWFRPGDLTATSRVESIRPLWWVAWAFDAAATVSWTADSDAAARRAEWSPHSGQLELTFDDLVVSASRGLAAAETTTLTPSYRLEEARDDHHDAPVGVTIERFDVARSVARRQILGAIERTVEQRLRDGVIPGRKFRHVRTAILLRHLVTRRLALPAWVLAYRYRDRLYRLVLSGRDERVLLGSAPYSVLKIAATIGAAGLALWLLLTLL